MARKNYEELLNRLQAHTEEVCNDYINYFNRSNCNSDVQMLFDLYDRVPYFRADFDGDIYYFEATPDGIKDIDLEKELFMNNRHTEEEVDTFIDDMESLSYNVSHNDIEYLEVMDALALEVSGACDLEEGRIEEFEEYFNDYFKEDIEREEELEM